jgi:hypothetical protein
VGVEGVPWPCSCNVRSRADSCDNKSTVQQVHVYTDVINIIVAFLIRKLKRSCDCFEENQDLELLKIMTSTMLSVVCCVYCVHCVHRNQRKLDLFFVMSYCPQRQSSAPGSVSKKAAGQIFVSHFDIRLDDSIRADNKR